MLRGSTLPSNPTRPANLRTKPLSLSQERRLVAYLDNEFLQLTRGYKKRTEQITTVPTLHKYITYARRLLAFILQIPPLDPSTSLRIQYMLRLTGDVLSAIVGYKLSPRAPPKGNYNEQVDRREETQSEEDEEPRDYTSALRELLDWLDDLDQAWLAVLQNQIWDPDAGEGVDLILEVEIANGEDTGSSSTEGENGHASKQTQLKSTPISQTDITRLRSLLVTSIANLEEWLSNPGKGGRDNKTDAREEDDVSGMLERLGVLDEFDDLFGRTMDFLSGFGGGFALEPETIVKGDDEEDEDADMVEVVTNEYS
ncbi:hypothetical protein Agabi119p4_1530 [Agaricus bisporus var. burnettii]|uniref:Uncharacterized protein n=1 Tax=Agaricus bisporus var. burnettii TaxID=192524 RepID=A0A8H7F7P4_AGABI|nr:hypothetical protein Agabi119p4_1530 [Agaricus bisporus var. burnettii]